ncbi:response regulator [Vibrio sp. ZSDE26]|uniref:histidine kinase n=1 Tax=Vibrio amylolyticus TaxID=2847292 RepID=A0A9X2BKW5_9VIBR|nr:response regulator [Vibrio amylolyticus]MCK6265012.1 response regulator [Vibrio amylolyticus]
MEIKTKEELNELLLELKRSQQRETNLALENRAILDAISAITGAQNKHQIFHELKHTLALHIDFDDFVVLSKTSSDAVFETFLTSNSAFVNLKWPQEEKFIRVLSGECIILFEPTSLSEFSHLNPFIKNQINSALLTGINTATSQSVILLLGNSKGRFPISTRDTLSRFRPLLERALIDIEQKERLQQLVSIRTAELKLAQEKAEEASKAKTQFLAMMSHELRTPLNTVLGLIEVLELELLDAKQLDSLRKMSASAELLLVLINDILDLTRIEAGQYSINYQWVELNSLLNQTVEHYYTQAKQKELELLCDFNSIANHYYHIDPIRLSQIVFNLIGNAIKFTLTGSVHVKANIDNDTLTITVSDTGIGIEESRLYTLFTPFIQADNSITRQFGGTGLGLTITKHLVELMNGEINVDSTLGHGATFSVEIPVTWKASVNSQNNETNNLECGEKPYKAQRVLVVEDTETNQMVIKLLLEKKGYNVTTLTNGKDAVEYLKLHNQSQDAVIMDVSMPIMDGLTATTLIRKFNQDIPIIALTAHAMKQDKEDCFKAGMNAFVTKPIRSQEIIRALESVI